MLTLKNLTASIGDKEILHDVNVSFDVGKIYAIMGPNGSGKSTLASVVMGSPVYSIGATSKIIWQDEDITAATPDERAKKGIFLSFQNPLALSGVTVFQLLRYALDGKKDPLEIHRQVEELAAKLKINPELLGRSLNDGFSGGERKKMEVLQAAVLNPEIIFFDEIDTGVDVDALRVIGEFLQELKKTGKTFVIITHHNKILDYLKPDEVIVIKGGRIVAQGNINLAEKIENSGYNDI